MESTSNNKLALIIGESVLTFLTYFLLSTTLQGQIEIIEGYNAFPDMSYLSKQEIENDSLQRLDLFVPTGNQPRPQLIWVGGGAWSYVDRSQEKDMAKQFVKQNIAFASVGHRNSPAVWRDEALSYGVQHPKHSEDLASAIKWLHQHASDYNLDTTRFFLGGFSSGAHLATLVAVDENYLQNVGLSKDLLKGIVAISGTYDIPHYHSVFLNGSRPELAKLHVEAVFGSTQDEWEGASPVNFLANLSTPLLLMADNTVYNYSLRFEESLRDIAFDKITSIYAHDLSHGDLWRDLSLNVNSIYRNAILSFLRAKS